MNTLLGTIITALVTDENDRFYFVQKDGVTFALAKNEGNHAIGDMVTGFAYTDSKQKSRLTQKEIKATRDSYDWGEVTEVRKDLGVFVDVGIPDKEIVVSLDVLPELKELWPKKGDKLYIKLDVDKKDRIWGLPAEPEVFQRMAGPAYDNMQNQKWPAIAYRLKLSGTFVYLPENNMLGFIHPSERYAEPRLGQVLEARVIGFREVDRTLNLSLKPRSFEMLENDAQMILTYLESNGGFMTLNDKSSPADIKATFGISKGQFKKALGGLMKAKKNQTRPVWNRINQLGEGMRKSFYTWLMTQRNPKSNEPVAILADLAFDDSTFPKHTDDFEEVSRYLEDQASFSFNLGQFDHIWEDYLAH